MVALKGFRFLSLIYTLSPLVPSTSAAPLLGPILGPITDVLGTIGSGAGLIEGTLGAIKGVLGAEQRFV